MQKAEALLNIYRKRGSKGLPLERIYRHLFDPELFLQAYGKIYRNKGAMTQGTTAETVDGMNLQRIHNIIGLLKLERYTWTPARRREIPKANGKTRPLGIPTWSDKLLQEVLRMLLEAYYEQTFSEHSHGFQPHRGCHSALREIRRKWKGTTWFIEADIKGCFDNIDHAVLLEIIRRDIHDGRLVRLLEGLLEAGYMEDWKYHETPGGTPQGGIISPLLTNIYLNDLDKWVESTLIPAYTRGQKRRQGKDYKRLSRQIAKARGNQNLEAVRRLVKERRTLASYEPVDPTYRRLHYVRYADDFILGFVGPKEEAERIRQQLGEFLGQKLKLTLSMEKTLITHATDEKAQFLGYEIKATRDGNLLAKNGTRATNGLLTFLMPQSVVRKYRDRFCKRGKPVQRPELLGDTDYTIIQRYQSVLRGVYNYYCMAVNVSRRMSRIKWILQTSLLKTLASKLRCRVSEIRNKYQVVIPALGDGIQKVLRVVIERPGKDPLIAIFGGIPFTRMPDGMGTVDFAFERTWFVHTGKRSEVVQRLLVEKCELCGVEGLPMEVHHIRKLADINRPGRRPKAAWEKIMSARKRKTLVVCQKCHEDITYGRYDGPSPRHDSPESRMR